MCLTSFVSLSAFVSLCHLGISSSVFAFLDLPQFAHFYSSTLLKLAFHFFLLVSLGVLLLSPYIVLDIKKPFSVKNTSVWSRP